MLPAPSVLRDYLLTRYKLGFTQILRLRIGQVQALALCGLSASRNTAHSDRALPQLPVRLRLLLLVEGGGSPLILCCTYK
jgi:hypothetical protein